jgi:hypothetical protein
VVLSDLGTKVAVVGFLILVSNYPVYSKVHGSDGVVM